MISIIVPIFNAEKTLHRCIDSILAQTEKDFELILVNDGSRDGSKTICDFYADRYENIRSIDKANGGVSTARNAGIEAAHGDYIAFVDADDRISPTYLEDFKIERYKDADLFIQGIEYFFPHNSRKRTMFSYPELEINLNTSPDKIQALQLLNNGCPVAKLFKRDIVWSNRLRFDPRISINEDHLFVIDYYKHIHKIVTLDAINYFYYYDFRVPSLTKIRHSSSEYLRIAELMQASFTEFIGRYPDQEPERWQNSLSVFGPSQVIKASKSALREESPKQKFKASYEAWQRLEYGRQPFPSDNPYAALIKKYFNKNYRRRFYYGAKATDLCGWCIQWIKYLLKTGICKIIK